MTCEPYANGQGWWHAPGCEHIDWEGDDVRDIRVGTAVDVLDEHGRFLFRGTIADSDPPWMFWHRIIPDGYVDLPPKFVIRPVKAR